MSEAPRSLATGWLWPAGARMRRGGEWVGRVRVADVLPRPDGSATLELTVDADGGETVRVRLERHR